MLIVLIVLYMNEEEECVCKMLMKILVILQFLVTDFEKLATFMLPDMVHFANAWKESSAHSRLE